jgi:hypothetical protein
MLAGSIHEPLTATRVATVPPSGGLAGFSPNAHLFLSVHASAETDWDA